MADYRLQNVVMEGVRLVFRNFSGKEDQYNRAGDKNFSVLLDNDTAAAMANDGWNIKELKPREEGDDATPYIQVAVNFKGPRPPRIVMITSRGRTELDENTVEMLDWADIQNVDLIISPYEWTVNGKSGVKAYLQKLFVTIEEDELDRKYAALDEPPFDPPYTRGE